MTSEFPFDSFEQEQAVSEAFVAERYWWNALPDGKFLDLDEEDGGRRTEDGGRRKDGRTEDGETED